MIGLPLLLLLLLLFWLLPPSTAKKIQTVCVLPKHLKTLKYLNPELHWEFYRPGDLIIGGNLPLQLFQPPMSETFERTHLYFLEGLQVSHFLQLGVGFEFSQGDRRVYPSFFRINPKESAQYEGLVQLLLHFQWNWVGLMANEDDGGERFVSSMMPMLKEKEICLAFTEVIKFDILNNEDPKLHHILNTWSKGEVIIFFGHYSSFTNILIVMFADRTHRYTSLLKVWIFTSNWKFNVMNLPHMTLLLEPYHGALQFRDHTRDVSEFSHFLMSLDPFNPQGDFFLHLWPGDFIIGGNFPLGTIHAFSSQDFKKKPSLLLENIFLMVTPKIYQESHFLQLGVGFEFTQGDGIVYPSFIWINPEEFPQYEGLVQLLLHFQWNWVGLLAPEDNRGERFISSLMPMLKEKEICLAFTEKLKSNFLTTLMLKILHIFETWSKAEVIVLFGDPNSIINVQAAMSVHEHLKNTSFWKVWILTSHWKLSVVRNQDIMKVLGVGFGFSQGDRRIYPSFFQIIPEETHQYVGLVQLLLYFQWNWVGLVASKDDRGEHFISFLVPMLKEKEICLAFPEIFSSDIKDLGVQLVFKILVEVEVIVLFGDSLTIMLVGFTQFRYRKSISLRKVWILPSYCELSVLGSREMLQFRKYFHGTLHFRDQTRDVSEFSHFLLSFDPLNPEGDNLFPL
ncbi:hypothetical protein E2320_022263, partial [Naja naja]